MGLPDQPTELPPGVTLLRSLEGHQDKVRSAAFDPAGVTLASGSDDKTIKLWEAKSGQLLRSLEGHEGTVHSVAFDPAGITLGSGSDDKTIKLWEAKSGQLLRTLEGHRDMVFSVAFNPAGETLASGSRDDTVKIWEAKSGQLLRTLEGHQDSVFSVAYDPAGETLASSSREGSVKLWEAKSGQLLRTLKGHRWYVLSGVFDPAGETLASGSFDKTVKLWEAKSGQLLLTLEGHTDRVFAVAWSRDGTLLASQSTDGTVRLWRCDLWEPVAVIPVVIFSSVSSALAFHPTEPLLATGGSLPGTPEDQRYKSIHLWQLDFNVLLGKSKVASSNDQRESVAKETESEVQGANVSPEVLSVGSEAAPTLVRRKRAANDFDVFLSYRSADRVGVTKIGEALKARGILPWLDIWELRPGQPWQEALERQIANIKAVAVFLGNEPLARWQREEVRTFVSEFVDRNCAVIPVILPDAKSNPEVPLFLRGFHAIDFRTAEPDPVEQLIWGITGERPA
jgi:WD40 repeat protein